MANDNLKKPVNDNKVPLTDEEKDKRKKIIILIGLIVVVLAILIGTAYYFSNSEKDRDSDDGKKNPGNIVKPVEKDDDEDKPEPVVNNNTNNVIVYRPVQRPVPVEPTVPENPTTITGSEEDSSVNVEFDSETRTINISGTSKYVAKVNENFGDGFNNIVQVKIVLNSKYEYADLEKMNFTVTTDVNNGKNNYFLDIVQEDENGNLYFYWLQAVGKEFTLLPKLTIDYGDGNVEEYTMDLSNLAVQTPLEEDEALSKALVQLPEGDKLAIGGAELDLNYKMTVLEDLILKEESDNTTLIAEDTTQPDNQVDPDNNPTEDATDKDKQYVLKFTEVTTAYDKDTALKLGYDGHEYIVAIRLYAPENFVVNDDNVNKVMFDKSHLKEGEKKVYEVNGNYQVTSDKSTFKLYLDSVKNRYFIIVTMAVDAEYIGDPYVSIDWDGDGNEHGTLTYIFDFSEFDYVESKVPETPTDPSVPPVDTGETTEDIDNDQSNTLASSNQESSIVSDGDITDDTLTEDEEDTDDALDNDTSDIQENTEDSDTTSDEEIQDVQDLETIEVNEINDLDTL